MCKGTTIYYDIVWWRGIVVNVLVLIDKIFDTKTRRDIKNPAGSNLDIWSSSLRISSHLPTPMENGGGDRF